MSDRVAERIASFDRWHYEFVLAGHRTPIFDLAHRNRHAQRRDMVFRPLLERYGGSLEGRRVLDLGCNAGWWALHALKLGAEFVLGIDGRPINVEQAEFVFETEGIDVRKYRFAAANLLEFDLAPYAQFDIVLCLGLLQHMSKPVEVMEVIATSGADTVVIDGSISRAPGSYWELSRQGPNAIADHAVDLELRMLPTKTALRTLVSTFGYTLSVLRPCFTSFEGCDDYRRGFRRGFLCTRGAAHTTVPTEPLTRISLLRDGAAWLTAGARHQLN